VQTSRYQKFRVEWFFLFSAWQLRRALQCQRQCSPRPTQPRRHAAWSDATSDAMIANSDATIGGAKKRRRQSSRRHRCMPPGRLFFPGRFVGASVPPLANVSCTPHRASADLPANLAFGGSGHANTINSRPTYSASEGDLRGHGVRLMKQRWRHGLRRRCDDQGKGGNNDQPDHWFPPCFSFRDQSCLVSAGKL
jgi:hypothetical protein